MSAFPLGYMLHIAVLCAQGLGDALLMMIPTHHFMLQGHTMTFYHDHPDMLAPLFPHVAISSYPDISAFALHFHKYDLLLVENDHGERAWTVHKLREENLLASVTFLFPTSPKYPHQPRDVLFDTKLPMASNLQKACQKLLQKPEVTKENGLIQPQGIKALHAKRIALHPTSKDPQRNWSKKQFLSLANKLTFLGYEPCFVLHEREKKAWEYLPKHLLFVFSELPALCQFLHESLALIGNDSGLGHLASNLGLPTVTISGNPKRARLWRPDWSPNSLATIPSLLLPNFKGIKLNLRDNYWQNFVTVDKVLRRFTKLITTYSRSS